MKRLVPITLVTFAALIGQTFFLTASRRDPTFDTPVVDSAVYHRQAVALADGRPLAPGAFWQPPLSPFVLGWTYRIFGTSLWTGRLLSVAIGVICCVLTFHLGRRVFGTTVGVVGACMLAFYGPFLFFQQRLLPTGLATMLNLAALLAMVRASSSRRLAGWSICGLLIGLAIVTIPNSAVLLIPAMLAAWVVPSRPARPVRPNRSACPPGPPRLAWPAHLAGRAGSVALVVIPALLPAALVGLRNHAACGRFVLISTNGGINFFIGNNPQRDDTIAIRPGPQWRRLIRQPLVAGYAGQVEQSRYFFRRAIDYASNRPTSFLIGLASKTAQVINAREAPRNLDIYTHRRFNPALAWTVWRAGPFAFPFGLLAPLAVAGAVLARPPRHARRVRRNRDQDENRATARNGIPDQSDPCASAHRNEPANRAACETAPDLSTPGASADAAENRAGPTAAAVCRLNRSPMFLVWFALLYLASVALFFPAARYRAPTIPVLLLLAALVVVRTARALRTGSTHRPRTSALAAMALTALAVNWPIHLPTDGLNFPSEVETFVGVECSTTGRQADAEKHLRRAIRLGPANVHALCMLARMLAERGDIASATVLAKQANVADPDAPETNRLAGDLARARGDNNEARRRYEQALAADATCAECLRALGEMDARDGHEDRAIDRFRQAIQLGSNDGYARLGLADLLAKRGQYAEAIQHYKQALWRLDPDPPLLHRIAWLLATCPQTELRDGPAALDLARQLCAMTDNREPAALDTLAAAYAATGQLENAIHTARRALELAQQRGDRNLIEPITRRLNIYEQLARQTRAKPTPP